MVPFRPRFRAFLPRGSVLASLVATLLAAACGSKDASLLLADGGLSIDGGPALDGGLADGGRDAGPSPGGGADGGDDAGFDAGPPDAGADAGPRDGGPVGPVFGDADAGAIVEIGTGQFTFEHPADGGVEIVCGPQGGQHVWVSIRAKNLDPRSTNLIIAMRPAAGGTAICGLNIREADLFPPEIANGWVEYAGIRCTVQEPALVAGQQMRLEGSVTDRALRDGGTQRVVVPFGPGMECIPGFGGGDGGFDGGRDGGP